jgi:AraC-like DNA-binding protein/quercetin dioxygenase-like cupin family protein
MKVRPFQILKLLDENLIIQEDITKGFYNHLHQHSEIQLSLIIRGKGKLVVGDSVHAFNDGDFFAIGPNSPHIFKPENKNAKTHMISVFFTKHTFGKDFFALSDLKEVVVFFDFVKDGFRPTQVQDKIVHSMKQLTTATRLSRIVIFLQLLKDLCDVDKVPLTQFVYPKQTGVLAGERLQIVFDYALHNFQEEIKLKTIADLVHMTTNAFCKFFKQRTNKTFFQFLIALRIEHARQLLNDEKEMSIAEISERSGFRSISNFNRKFKAFEKTIPSNYKKKGLGRIEK